MRFACVVAVILGWMSVTSGAVTPIPKNSIRPDQPKKYPVVGMEEYLPQLTKALALIVHGDVDRGLEFIDPDRKIKSSPQFDMFKQQFTALCERWGNYHGCEPMSVKCVTARLHRIQVMCCFDNLPVIFTFTLYKPKNEWRCMGFNWEATAIDTLFDKHATQTNLGRMP